MSAKSRKKRPCAAPHKIAHKTREKALGHILMLERAGRGNPDLNAYQCPAGHWHVGHSAFRLAKRIKRALREGRA